ncbi:uncharacterized protein LOC115760467 [Drosophila novamexicana]|uniref:uncharacterized protein LOC115760467 n=1 Tax=Drosophila novamexicana TaxID=47314 RepID=UPI0011E595A5|nr:uncharacterized protein LOC115760467 [Drosophila novamexicana]
MDKCNECKISAHAFITIIHDEERLMSWLKDHGLILKGRNCPGCGEPCKCVPLKGDFYFRCRLTHTFEKNKKKITKKCNFLESVRANTFFAESRLSIRTICLIVYYELIGVEPITSFLKTELALTYETIVNWRSYLREVFQDWAAQLNIGKLGGAGKTVRIDESLVSKRKNNCGRIIQGQWVFSIYERDTKRIYIAPAEKRTKNTLLHIIKEKIEDGTTIISDCWSSYRCLSDEAFEHLAVYHSMSFVDPITKASRDSNDGLSKKNSTGYLATYFFKSHYPNHTERFHHAFAAIARLYNPYLGSASIKLNCKYDEYEDELDDLC